MTQQPTVLIVEDEAPLRQAVAIKLRALGYDIIEATNGEEGLKRARESKPSLILLDHLMPVMDGTTMLKELRTDGWGRQVKVIMMTNMNEVKTMNDSIQAGVNDYILKSDIKLEDLAKMVQEHLPLN